MNTLNLTQHVATLDQLSAGVVDISNPSEAKQVQNLLTFRELPTTRDVVKCAEELARLAAQLCQAFECHQVLIGGAPFLMGPLERALRKLGIAAVYAFSYREVEEVTQQDGSVRKVAVFRHLGFVEA
jgi:hypothetical protein